MATLMRCLARLLGLLPLQDKIVLMSRQSSVLSLDYRLLIDALRAGDPRQRVVTCLTEPEIKSRFGFIWGTARQLYQSATARVCILDGYVPAVSIPDRRKGTVVIEMWHALGAIKRFGYQSLDTPGGRTSAQARIGRMHRNYDYVIAGGPGAVPAFAEAFDLPAQKVLPLGLPRLDYLQDDAPDSTRNLAAKRIAGKYPVFDDGRTTVLYAPTLRREKDDWLAGYATALAEYLPESLDLVVAGHPLDDDGTGFDAQAHPRVTFISGEATIDLLGLVDCVITDYSAIAFEAGRLGKPVFFYVPDIEDYRLSPGLNIDPLEAFTDCASSEAGRLWGMLAYRLERSSSAEDTFAAFIARYFEGVEPGVSRRIASFVLSIQGERSAAWR